MSRIRPNYQRSILGIFGFGSLKRRHFCKVPATKIFLSKSALRKSTADHLNDQKNTKSTRNPRFPAFLEHFRDFEHFHVFSRIPAFCLSFGTQEQNHRGPGMKAWRTRKHPKSWVLGQSAVDLEFFWIRIPETTLFLKGSSDKDFFL